MIQTVGTFPDRYQWGAALCNDEKKLAAEGVFREQLVLWFFGRDGE